MPPIVALAVAIGSNWSSGIARTFQFTTYEPTRIVKYYNSYDFICMANVSSSIPNIPSISKCMMLSYMTDVLVCPYKIPKYKPAVSSKPPPWGFLMLTWDNQITCLFSRTCPTCATWHMPFAATRPRGGIVVRLPLPHLR